MDREGDLSFEQGSQATDREGDLGFEQGSQATDREGENVEIHAKYVSSDVLEGLIYSRTQ